MLKKIWNDPVWSKVISAAIIASVGVPIAYFNNWFSIISNFISLVLPYLIDSATVPRWVLGLLVIFSILFFIMIATGAFFLRAKKTSLDWRAYVTDQFDGLKWRWRYIGDSMDDVTVYCTTCDYQVYATYVRSNGIISRFIFCCEHCNSNIGPFDGTYPELEDKALRLAQQKIRNGTWINANNGIHS